VKSAQDFYDGLSADYDSMIGFDSSLQKRIEALRAFIEPADITAADLGCGSGLDSIALAKLSLTVTGFDISEQMIVRAIENSNRLGADVSFYAYAASKIPASFNTSFNFALSLGNAFANINPRALTASLKKMYALLKPGGHILIQILNYDRILKKGERIVGITEKENCTFVRFYDFGKEKTFFNILKIARGEKTEHSLLTTEIFPYKKREMAELIKLAGFKKPEFFGGLNKNVFNRELSQDLVIAARK
jgi:ubiquinone/menaquinone biosynthesis C-methylase UbiE